MNNYICHHGIKGMHWGVRRYQKPDGTLTSAGKKRMAYRDEYVKKYEKARQTSRDNIADVNKRQKLSDREYLDKYKKEIEYDAEISEEPIKKVEDRWIKELRERDKESIERSRSYIRTNNAVIKNVRTTPINELSAAEVYKRTDLITKGGAVAGGLMGAAAGSVGGPAYAVGFGVVGSMMGAANASSIASKHYSKIAKNKREFK